VPLNAAAVAALRAQRVSANKLQLAAKDWTELGLVFPNRYGKPLREDRVLKAFHRVCASAGIPRKRMHDLRHSLASHAYANGADLRDIQDLLGHSKLETTSAIYTASAPNRLRAAVEGVSWGSPDKEPATGQTETSSAGPTSRGLLGA
jgi:site-specific recombinase XerD